MKVPAKNDALNTLNLAPPLTASPLVPVCFPVWECCLSFLPLNPPPQKKASFIRRTALPSFYDFNLSYSFFFFLEFLYSQIFFFLLVFWWGESGFVGNTICKTLKTFCNKWSAHGRIYPQKWFFRDGGFFFSFFLFLFYEWVLTHDFKIQNVPFWSSNIHFHFIKEYLSFFIY